MLSRPLHHFVSSPCASRRLSDVVSGAYWQYHQRNQLVERKDDKQSKNILEEMNDKYVYARPSVNIVNNEKFLARIRQMEEESKVMKPKIDGFKFPFLLAFFMAFIYWQWETLPYKVVFKHATISDFILAKNYFHSIFTAALSIAKLENLAIYGPALLYSIHLCGYFMRQRHLILLFTSNALITGGVTYAYEKNKDMPMIAPKANGAVTPLSFLSAFAAIKPNYFVLGNRGMPFFIIPATYFMYECYQWKNSEESDTCRPAHISALAYGLAFGLLFKRFAM